MKKRIWNLVAIAIMVTAIVVSVFQLNIPTVRAAGCPQSPMVDGCFDCRFESSVSSTSGGVTYTTCYYTCFCYGGGGGGEPMYIEREVTLETVE
jgi:hypothetical protein